MEKGDIIVRVGRDFGSRAEIGKLHKVHTVFSSSYGIHGGWSVQKAYSRKATIKETEAYNNGCRNISKIKKVVIDNFSII